MTAAASPSPRTGVPAPDLTLATTDGSSVRLSDLWAKAPRALALVLVRHFG